MALNKLEESGEVDWWSVSGVDPLLLVTPREHPDRRGVREERRGRVHGTQQRGYKHRVFVAVDILFVFKKFLGGLKQEKIRLCMKQPISNQTTITCYSVTFITNNATTVFL